MRYASITKDDMLNGTGIRVVLWLTGCDHYCVGCQNDWLWEHSDGSLFDEVIKNNIFKELSKDYVSGITLSGGDPLYRANREGVINLCKEIRVKHPNKTIWIYTGYTWDEILKNDELKSVIEQVDVAVTGRYVEYLKDTNYRWAGSRNQLVIDVKKSLEGGLILYEDY